MATNQLKHYPAVARVNNKTGLATNIVQRAQTNVHLESIGTYWDV